MHPRMKQALPMRLAVLAPVTMKGAIASGMAQTSISASQGAQPAPAPMSGIIASQAGQAEQDDTWRSLPKFTKKSNEASANISPSFFPQTPLLTVNITQASCKAESSLSGSSCGLCWTLEPELPDPAPIFAPLSKTFHIHHHSTTPL